jgi:protein-S-isoprenylcysteine O-methyltransferase Ste14
VTSVAARPRIDTGRLAMVPAAALMLMLDVTALTRATASAGPGAAEVLGWAGTALICAFYALIIWSYLRRGPAVATTRSITASAVAIVATFAPFTFPLLAGPSPGTARQLAADLLLVAGTSWSVCSLRFLGRNLSVIAQARGVTDRGPYRFVRHPLYTGEIVSALGLAIASGTAAGFGIWLAIVGMQVYRAVREEQVLLAALPGYRDYRARTAALVPGLF